MGREYYKGHDSYVIYGEDSDFGTAGTPSGSNTFGKVTSANYTVSNNFIRSQGIGEGRNATQARLGNVDISGTLNFEIDNFSIFQYAIGEVSGTGTAADPYEVEEKDNIGYNPGFIPTLSLEFGNTGSSNDNTELIDGCAFESFSIEGTVGEIVTGSLSFKGRKLTTGTSLETYSPNANGGFVPVSGSVDIDGDSMNLVNFSLNGTTGLKTFYEFGSRLISQPLTGIRRYDFTITMKKDFNDTASTLSGLEARNIALSGSTSGTTNIDSAEMTKITQLTINMTEGSSTGDRVVDISLEDVYFENYSETINIDGETEITITGFGLKGDTDGSEQVPIRWYTVA